MSFAATGSVASPSEIETRREPEEWQALLDGLSAFQHHIFQAARRTKDDIGVLAARLNSRGVWVYELTLTSEAGRFGYYVAQVSLTDEDILALIEQETGESASGIVDTYNYELIREMLRLGEEYEEESVDYYDWQLFGPGGWWDRRRQWKDVQIGTWETWRRISQGMGDFYRRNPELPVEMAEVLPYGAVCPACQALVNGNPYSIERAVQIMGELPLHINCPHYVHTFVTGKAEGPLWLGG